MFDQAKQNSPLALNVVDQACDYLGLALANVANVLNLEEIIIGGGVAAAGEF
ncbi:ROK family protein [Lactobacillus sp. R2/2]|nr:ROK family protein [Lactobacillus sp. R2/2]